MGAIAVIKGGDDGSGPKWHEVVGFWVYFRGRVNRFGFTAQGKERSQVRDFNLSNEKDLFVISCDEGDGWSRF